MCLLLWGASLWGSITPWDCAFLLSELRKQPTLSVSLDAIRDLPLDRTTQLRIQNFLQKSGKAGENLGFWKVDSEEFLSDLNRRATRMSVSLQELTDVLKVLHHEQKRRERNPIVKLGEVATLSLMGISSCLIWFSGSTSFFQALGIPISLSALGLALAKGFYEVENIGKDLDDERLSILGAESFEVRKIKQAWMSKYAPPQVPRFKSPLVWEKTWVLKKSGQPFAFEPAHHSVASWLQERAFQLEREVKDTFDPFLSRRYSTLLVYQESPFPFLVFLVLERPL